MSVRERLNSLSDQNLLQEAISTLQRKASSLTASDSSSVFYLIQKCLNSNLAELATRGLLAMNTASVRMMSYEFQSCLKGVLRVGTVNQAMEVVLDHLKVNTQIDPKTILTILQDTIELKEPGKVLQIVEQMQKKGLPLTQYFWQDLTKQLLRYDFVYMVSQCFEIADTNLVNNQRVWESFIEACLFSGNLELACNTIEKLKPKTEVEMQSKIWNILLRKASVHSMSSAQELISIINKINSEQIPLEQAGLGFFFHKLVDLSQFPRLLAGLRRMKNRVDSKIISGLIQKLLDTKNNQTAIQVLEMVANQQFLPQVKMENLSLTGEKLKWLLTVVLKELIVTKGKNCIESEEDEEFELLQYKWS